MGAPGSDEPCSNFLKGGYIGDIIGLIHWDTRRLDYSSDEKGHFSGYGIPLSYWLSRYGSELGFSV